MSLWRLEPPDGAIIIKDPVGVQRIESA